MTAQAIERNIQLVTNEIKHLSCDSVNDNEIDFDFYDSVDKKNSDRGKLKNCIKECENPSLSKNESNRVSFVESKNTNDVSSKDLMNCIAYESATSDRIISKYANNSRHTATPDSLSSDTTSDITEVTPRASSSGCSSLSKCETKTRSTTPRKVIVANKKSHDVQKVENDRPLKFLKEALDSLEAEERSIGSHGSERRRYEIQRNMTFTKDELRKIERENQILLRKIEDNFKQKPKYLQTAVTYRRLSSSAINRQRQQKRIEHDNLILLKKIEKVKGTINAIPMRRL